MIKFAAVLLVIYLTSIICQPDLPGLVVVNGTLTVQQTIAKIVSYMGTKYPDVHVALDFDHAANAHR